MTIFIHGKPEPVQVPEADIQAVIQFCSNWLKLHTERDDCKIAIFGHDCYTIKRSQIEADVREAAKTAVSYRKA